MMNQIILKSLLFTNLLFMIGCANTTRTVLESENQVQLRQIQSRRFETSDTEKTLKTAIATLQDLGFVIDKADSTLGTVSATKLNRYAVRMTVTVRPYGENQVIVRANAQYNNKAIEEASPYQQFFNAFEKALFLTAHNVD